MPSSAEDILDFVRSNVAESPERFDIVLMSLLALYDIEVNRMARGEHNSHVRRFVFWHVKKRFEFLAATKAKPCGAMH